MGAQSSTSVRSLSSRSTLLYTCPDDEHAQTIQSHIACPKTVTNYKYNKKLTALARRLRNTDRKMHQNWLKWHDDITEHDLQKKQKAPISALGLRSLISIHCMQIENTVAVPFLHPTKLFGIHTTHRFCTKRHWKFGAKLLYDGLFAFN